MRSVQTSLFSLLLCLGVACSPGYIPDEAVAGQLPEIVDFNFHIKPILSDRCFSCHGPDQNALKADLRLDTRAGAMDHALASGGRAFVSGNLQRSEAFQRIVSSDPGQQMPPPEFQRRLSSYEIALIARWIEQGADYKPHWSFIPPQKLDPMGITNCNWCQNPIDHFIKQKLEANGLSPEAEADKETLLRRVTLDLIGIPPTLQEIDDFLADTSPDAYEKVVDRLLASPHFGENMALSWLDLARYADSNGYSQDGLRVMWPWRDWVIRAFNENMPYDKFVRWQIAGDKIPAASQEQKLATGFLRNHRQNGEGGIVDEEYRIEYTADRTETAATVFLGLTLQCARCHDHKYDPISQEEYYRFFSFFNSIHEAGITASDRNSGPEVVLTNKEVDERIKFIEQQIEAGKKKAETIAADVSASLYAEPAIDLEQGLIVELSFDKKVPAALKNEVYPGEVFTPVGEINTAAGIKGQALKFTGYDFVRIVKDAVKFDRADAFSFSFYLHSNYEGPYMSVLNNLGSKGNNYPGYEIAIIDGYPAARLVHSFPARLIHVRGTKKLERGAWNHFTFTYDGSGKAAGIRLYHDGDLIPVTTVYDKLTQGIANVGKGLTIGGRMSYQTEVDGRGSVDELKIYNRELSAVEAYALYHGSVGKISWMAAEKRKDHYLKTGHKAYRELQRQIRKLRQEKFGIEDTLVSVMVMEDLPVPRPTFVLARGAYDAPEKEVTPGTPSAIGPADPEGRSDRSDLARWLLDAENPLTARIQVNRLWQHFFGQGIVKTTDDFGSQGALPSHPGLLDWLAVKFVESGWDMKEMQRLIVLSATYRQSARTGPDKRASDPDNILLARGPSRRLSAELIRDVALTASGLLDRSLGGPSVKPYQPEGLWSEKGEFSKLKNYQQDHGSKLYRRSLYTFWRRTSPPPAMTTFDAPTRDICVASRQETNTPLQALVLLNDPQFVEAARVLAEKAVRATTEKAGRIAMAYRSLTGLTPKPETIELLVDLERGEFAKYRRQPQQTRQLLQIGEFPHDPALNSAEVAAMTIVCSTIMSFDETLMKR